MLTEDSAAFIGIEIGGTKVQLVRGNTECEIVDRRRFTVNKSEGGAGIRREIERLLPELAKRRAIRGVGVGFGGPVDGRTGRICCSHQIEGWSEFPLGSWIEELTGAPARVDNDADTGAFAEALLGAGKKSNPVFYVTLGSGVGGGLVVDGKIYHGAMPGEAEIGHVRLDKSGRIVEESCSGWAVDRKIHAAIAKSPQSPLARLALESPGGEARHLLTAVRSGDSAAEQILDSTCEDLAFALSHVTHLCHPEMIVLGGGLSLMGNTLAERVQQHLKRFVMHAFSPGPKVSIAALGEDVVPTGALLLAKQAYA